MAEAESLLSPLVLCEPSSSSTTHFWYSLTPLDVKESAIKEVKETQKQKQLWFFVKVNDEHEN